MCQGIRCTYLMFLFVVVAEQATVNPCGFMLSPIGSERFT